MTLDRRSRQLHLGPGDRHSVFYAHGIRTVAEEDAYAGYLVSLHASGIYSGRYGWRGLEPIAWDSIGEAGRRFLTQQKNYRCGLLAELLKEREAQVEFEATCGYYVLLQTCDSAAWAGDRRLRPKAAWPFASGGLATGESPCDLFRSKRRYWRWMLRAGRCRSAASPEIRTCVQRWPKRRSTCD